MGGADERKKLSGQRPWHTRFGFRNLAPPEVRVGMNSGSRWLWSRARVSPLKVGTDVPTDHIVPAEEAVGALRRAEDGSEDFITWLGHCAFLIRLGGVTFLTDPFLKGTTGPALFPGLRRLPVNIDVEGLTPDYLLLSHAHRDHLHGQSMLALRNKSAKVICPVRVGKKAARYGFSDNIELDWFEEASISEDVTVTALPAHHYSEPYLWRSLWAGFSIRSGDKKVYFSGDTGYSSIFKDHIAEYGPFDLALVGVGCYQLDFPGEQASIVHTSPQQALRIAQEINARRLIGMHWGTARMTDEDQMRIPSLVRQSGEEVGVSADTMRIGETRRLWTA